MCQCKRKCSKWSCALHVSVGGAAAYIRTLSASSGFSFLQAVRVCNVCLRESARAHESCMYHSGRLAGTRACAWARPPAHTDIRCLGGGSRSRVIGVAELHPAMTSQQPDSIRSSGQSYPTAPSCDRHVYRGSCTTLQYCRMKTDNVVPLRHDPPCTPEGEQKNRRHMQESPTPSYQRDMQLTLMERHSGTRRQLEDSQGPGAGIMLPRASLQ